MSDATGGAYYRSDNILNLENMLISLFDKGSGWTGVNQYQGVIAQGEQKQLTVPISANQETAKITLNWPDSDLGIELLDPAKMLVDLNRSDIVYSGANSKPKAIIITNPMAGDWTVKISGLDVPEGRTDFSLDVKAIPRKETTLPVTPMNVTPNDLQRQLGIVLLLIIGVGIGVYVIRRQ